MSDEELGNIIPELKKIQHISLRELSSVGRLASLLGRELTFVADPTFLLSAQEWKNALGISEDGKEHILYYSLRSIKIQKDATIYLKMLHPLNICSTQLHYLYHHIIIILYSEY